MVLVVAMHTRFLGRFIKEVRNDQDLATCDYPSQSQTCQNLHRNRCHRRIAVVGNGPLSEEQRQEINSNFDIVIRFNKLNNWLCGDQLGVWLMRSTDEARSTFSYQGLGQLELCSSKRALESASAVWLLGGSQANASHMFASYPELTAKSPIVVQLAPWQDVYSEVVGQGAPSSGWIGMMLALECLPTSGEVHVYGFNWAHGHYWAHNMYAENAFTDMLDEAGKVIVHTTPCGGLRDCEGCYVLQESGGKTSCSEDAVPGVGDVPRLSKEAREPQDVGQQGKLSRLDFLMGVKGVRRGPQRSPSQAKAQRAHGRGQVRAALEAQSSMAGAAQA